MKKIIGIIPSTIGFSTNNPFEDKYYVQNSYINRINKAGGIPIIIPPINLKINNDALELCHSFLIIGGTNVHKYHFDIIDYAIKNNKKLLGICMGMQAIAMYSNNDYEEKTLYKVDNHYSSNIKNNKELLMHPIAISKNSILESLLGTNIEVNSVHNYAVKKVSYPFRIVGKYKEIIEAIEYNNIIGVQFHPELMNNTDKLFYWLTN